MSNQDKEEEKPVMMPSWFMLSMLCIFIAVVIVVLYLQLVRYALVARSIDKGAATTSALLLTPEIAMSIASLI